MSENIYFSNAEILITDKTIKFDSIIYKVSDVRAVSLQTRQSQGIARYAWWSRFLTYCIIGLLLLTLLLVVVGAWGENILTNNIPLTWGDLMVILTFSAVIVVSAVRLRALALLNKTILVIHLIGDFGDVNAITSTNGFYIQKILAAIKATGIEFAGGTGSPLRN